MPYDLEQLGSSEKLLMYLADELPAEQRTRLDAVLAEDASLRAELELLRDLQSHFHSSIEHSDAGSRLMVTEASAVRKVGRAMQKWQVERFHRPAHHRAEESRLTFPWWCYPLATAAAVVFAAIVWFGNTPESTTTIAGGARNLDPASEVVAAAEESWGITAEPVDNGPQQATSTDELNAAFSEQAG